MIGRESAVDEHVRPRIRRYNRFGPDRATSAVVGVAVLVGVTLLLASVCGALLATGAAEPTPTAGIDGTLTAADGWPDGQRFRLVHRAGDTLVAEELAFVVTAPRADASARLTEFPTRRLTDENVHGEDVFDNGYAGVDGAVDAAHTDGRWASGEAVEFRIARDELDLRPGDTVHVRIVHEPTNAVVARLSATAR